jgi:hypothetical protein
MTSAEKTPKPKPVMFIGSSAEALTIASAIEIDMHHDFAVKKWTAGVFMPSSWPLADLEKQANETSFGVFVFGRDDVLQMRGETLDSTRDNVIFELGLFAGRLGRENCYVVVPSDREGLHLPSDLEGLALLPYDDVRARTDVQAALSPVCARMRIAISDRQAALAGAASFTQHVPLQSPPASQLPRYLEDLLQMISKGRAGLQVSTTNEQRLRTWHETLLKMALDAVSTGRPQDAYAIWLKPLDQDDPDALVPYVSANFPTYDRHYRFTRREGLAGNVWALGQTAIHSAAHPNPNWTVRAGCDNASYIAVPVGEQGGAGGVLAVGSDTGFEPTEDDVRALRLYAAVLALSL